jgi:hypothetical protein
VSHHKHSPVGIFLHFLHFDTVQCDTCYGCHICDMLTSHLLQISLSCVTTTVANLTIPYCVQIDTTLPPATAGICVYTDGSLLEERSGAGVYIEVDRQPQVTMSERLPPCTVFQSELRAIQMACEHLCLHEHNNKDIHIHVDSQAALQSLTKSQITSKTVHQTVELLREMAG